MQIRDWSHGPKKWQESNNQFDSQPLNPKTRLKTHVICVNVGLECMIWHWKGLSKGYNFTINFFSIGTFMWNLWAHKVAGFITWQNWGFLGLLLEDSKILSHFDVAFVAIYKIYHREDTGEFLPILNHGILVIGCWGLFVHHFGFNLH